MAAAKTWSYATPEDVPGLTNLLLGLLTGPRFQHIFPEAQGTQDFVRTIYDCSVNPPPAGSQPWQDRKVVVVRDDDGKILSSIVYYICRPEDKGFWLWKKRFPPPTPEMGLDEGVLDQLFGNAENFSAKYMGEEPHIYVEFAVTQADHRRKGYMGMLLDMGNQLADDMDYPMFLLSSAMGKAGYLRREYEILEGGDGPGPCPMIRKRKSERM
ncbi:hypothetical protein GQ53DRAFT_750557 [Thozetella sp. PMI_491]|nr:hypothetical protein GQ53DRAFT_750557 [Thozetella sp. PMI_491]